MTKLTTAFLGVAHIHTPNFINKLNDRHDEIVVAAVYDRDRDRGEKRAGELAGAKFVESPDAIFDDPSIGSVVVCAETVLHRDLVVAAAKAGKHIFCEKPLGVGAVDAREMAAAIHAAKVTFQTGYFQRGDGGNRFIRREVQAGHLGKITRVRYTSCHGAVLGGWFDTEWRWLADINLAGGGAMLDMGAHPLDLIIHTFRQTEGEVVNVAGSLGNRVGRYGSEVDEYGAAQLTFASGAIASIEASWVDPSLQSPIEVFGTEGQIQGRGGEFLYYSKHVEGADGKIPVTGLPEATPHAFDLFWDALLGKSLPIELVSVDEALLGTELMERIFMAAGRTTTKGLA